MDGLLETKEYQGIGEKRRRVIKYSTNRRNANTNRRDTNANHSDPDANRDSVTAKRDQQASGRNANRNTYT